MDTYIVVPVVANINMNCARKTNQKKHNMKRYFQVSLLLTLIASCTALPVTSKPTPIMSSCRHECIKADKELSNSAKIEQLVEIQMKCRVAQQYSEEFKDNFTRQLFHASFDEQVDKMSYIQPSSGPDDGAWSWLPVLPKQAGQDNVSEEVLQALKMETEILRLYKALQVYSIGLEQVTLDQAMYGGDFHENFNTIVKEKLLPIICRLKLTACILGLDTSSYEVDRSVMSTELQNTDSESMREFRDWIIFREYVNGVEYTLQSIDHFIERLGQQ